MNPLLWVAYVVLCRDIELACDEKVIRHMEAAEKKRYSEVLLACSIHRRGIAACPLAFGEVGVRQRIRAVLHYKKPALWILIVSLLLMYARLYLNAHTPLQVVCGYILGIVCTFTPNLIIYYA
jgi:beta-lactamase regulating signal transducer with metallopeptidase domain